MEKSNSNQELPVGLTSPETVSDSEKEQTLTYQSQSDEPTAAATTFEQAKVDPNLPKEEGLHAWLVVFSAFICNAMTYGIGTSW
ncbi:hypothetical protein INT43_002527 [Umbelopsis isabellina]|uniref:Uncharacterized protein n=1 Tax=Mortierella isabellina TaxID=91625 RepID=A0A8H7Q412_MORIS|nr:hypothetical protein INT43_002527 [Umbelopsis isabellina]